MVGWIVGTHLMGCGPEANFTDLDPRIAVAPDALAFGAVAVPTEAGATLFITNNGRADLEIELTVEDGPFSVPLSSASVVPATSLELQIGFRPPSFLPYTSTLVVTSNDELSPRLEVPLSGTGVDQPTPDIEIDPSTLDFGIVPVGSTATEFITVSNLGDAPLTLGDLAQAGSGAFSLATDPSDNIVGANSDVPVLITFAPTSDDGDAGTLQFPSNDPDEPVREVVLLGNGGGDFAYPVAVVDCPATSEPPIWVTFDGASSSDPAGHLPLTYSWRLIDSPSGTQQDLLNPTSPQARLFTDVAGDYDVELVVTNAIGTRSAPARCEVAAIPADELHVELLWDTPSADLDLHLARNGADLFAVPDDATFCNTSPNWGAAGSDDDPRLDLDDQGGFGPENLNVRTPAESAFQVRVHYFEENADDVVNATVRVFTYGVLAWEGQRPMVENEVWDVGIVNWPAGTFGVQSVPNRTAPARSCL